MMTDTMQLPGLDVDPSESLYSTTDIPTAPGLPPGLPITTNGDDINADAENADIVNTLVAAQPVEAADGQAPEGDGGAIEDPGTPLGDENEDEDSDSDDDDIQIKIDPVKPGFRNKTATGLQKLDIDATVTFGDKSIYELDFENMEDKPWRKPGADMTDYFNYGFTEDTWIVYCERQRKLRAEFSTVQANKLLFANVSGLANAANERMKNQRPKTVVNLTQELNRNRDDNSNVRSIQTMQGSGPIPIQRVDLTGLVKPQPQANLAPPGMGRQGSVSHNDEASTPPPGADSPSTGGDATQTGHANTIPVLSGNNTVRFPNMSVPPPVLPPTNVPPPFAPNMPPPGLRLPLQMMPPGMHGPPGFPPGLPPPGMRPPMNQPPPRFGQPMDRFSAPWDPSRGPPPNPFVDRDRSPANFSDRSSDLDDDDADDNYDREAKYHRSSRHPRERERDSHYRDRDRRHDYGSSSSSRYTSSRRDSSRRHRDYEEHSSSHSRSSRHHSSRDHDRNRSRSPRDKPAEVEETTTTTTVTATASKDDEPSSSSSSRRKSKRSRKDDDDHEESQEKSKKKKRSREIKKEAAPDDQTEADTERARD